MAPETIKITDRDYTHTPVPESGRLPAIQIFSIWLGFILVVGLMAVGGGLASQLSKLDFLNAVLIGNLVLAVFAAFTGYIGAKSGRAFNQLVAIAFPGASSRIANLYVPIVLIGWYAVESALFGSFIGHALKLSPFFQGTVAVIFSLCFATSSYIGYRGLKWVSYFMVPIIFVFGTYSIIAVFKQNNLSFGFGSPITLATGISYVISSWIMGILTALPDLTRFCKKPIYGALVGGIGILVANGFNMIIGGYGASLTKESDPAVILCALGFIIAGLIFSLANIWTTNDSNMYAASLNLSSATRISRRKCIVIATLIGIVLMLLHPERLSFIFSFLSFMGNTAPALGGVVYTSYFLKKQDNDDYAVWIPWTAWVLGSLASWWVGGLWSLPLGMAIASIVMLVTCKTQSSKISRGS